MMKLSTFLAFNYFINEVKNIKNTWTDVGQNGPNNILQINTCFNYLYNISIYINLNVLKFKIIY